MNRYGHYYKAFNYFSQVPFVNYAKNFTISCNTPFMCSSLHGCLFLLRSLFYLLRSNFAHFIALREIINYNLNKSMKRRWLIYGR